MKSKFNNNYIKRNLSMLRTKEGIFSSPIVDIVNLDVHKIGNFTRGTKVIEMLDECEQKPGIKFQFVAKFARLKNGKVNHLVDAIAGHGVRAQKDKYIVIKKNKRKAKVE